MTSEEARRRFSQARVARLATADRASRPHIVPLVFALDGDRLLSAVDHKPKRSTALRRVANIAANPAVAVIVDDYSEDWDRLWWARADGSARLLEPDAPEAEAAWERLVQRYDQYQGRRPLGPVIVVDVDRWSGWSAFP